jgi:hypothetical protein
MKMVLLIKLIAIATSMLNPLQDNPTRQTDILAALHCATLKGSRLFEGLIYNSRLLDVSEMMDNSSYHGQPHVILIIYQRRSNIILLFRKRLLGRRTILDLQNNATFMIKAGRIIFDNPPLEGEWTQSIVKNSINKMVRLPRYKIDPNLFIRYDTKLECESF